MTKIKCGIIGYGKMGKIRAQAINKSGFAQVIAVYDPELVIENDIFNVNEIINSIQKTDTSYGQIVFSKLTS